MLKHKPSKQVAIVVPLSTRPELTADEHISLRHLRHYLGHYDKFMVLPEGLDVAHDGFEMMPLDRRFFGSARAHVNMLVSPSFYKRFRNYRYILIHHLDVLVFSDPLADWCERGYDFIAPPWIQYDGAPYSGMHFENQVGNGGFSLRNVESFLGVLRAVRRPRLNRAYLRRILRRAKKIETKDCEDVFWGVRAKQFVPDFRVAPLDVALEFGFECNPRLCLEKTGGKLPFGCHAWTTYDRAFWEPYLLPDDTVPLPAPP